MSPPVLIGRTLIFFSFSLALLSLAASLRAQGTEVVTSLFSGFHFLAFRHQLPPLFCRHSHHAPHHQGSPSAHHPLLPRGPQSYTRPGPGSRDGSPQTEAALQHSRWNINPPTRAGSLSYPGADPGRPPGPCHHPSLQGRGSALAKEHL